MNYLSAASTVLGFLHNLNNARKLIDRSSPAPASSFELLLLQSLQEPLSLAAELQCRQETIRYVDPSVHAIRQVFSQHQDIIENMADDEEQDVPVDESERQKLRADLVICLSLLNLALSSVYLRVGKLDLEREVMPCKVVCHSLAQKMLVEFSQEVHSQHLQMACGEMYLKEVSSTMRQKNFNIVYKGVAQVCLCKTEDDGYDMSFDFKEEEEVIKLGVNDEFNLQAMRKMDIDDGSFCDLGDLNMDRNKLAFCIKGKSPKEQSITAYLIFESSNGVSFQTFQEVIRQVQSGSASPVENLEDSLHELSLKTPNKKE